MAQLRDVSDDSQTVLTDFVTLENRRHLLGIAFLPAIGWFEVTLIDLDVLMPVDRFLPIVLVFTVFLVVSLAILYLMLRRWLLNPIAGLEQAMQLLRDRRYDDVALPKGQGEMGKLIRIFSDMAQAIREQTRELEGRVQERTKALEELTRLDPLTNLFNRRGITEIIEAEMERQQRQNHQFGVFWIDLDHFKALNDSFGHATGDEALQVISSTLVSNLRRYDNAARWGGDEFLVILSPCDKNTLDQLGQRLCMSIAEAMKGRGWEVTASIGGYLVQPGDSLDQLLQQADDAMYRAKAEGRNRLNLA